MKQDVIFVPSTVTLFTLGALLTVFFSDWFANFYSLFYPQTIRGEILVLSLATYFILKRWKILPVTALTVSTCLFLLWSFICYHDGNIFSDDHPTFLYRLLLLKEQFPSIPFYNPLWNAGIDQRDFFATGALNLFLLLSPVLYLVDVANNYKALIGLVFFILLPLLYYFAARVLGFSNRGGCIASLLSLSTSLLWYRWALQYGTLGFITTTGCIPIVLALSTKILDKTGRSITFGEALATIFFTTLMLLWSPSGIVFLPIIALGFHYFGDVIHKRYIPLILVVLFCINIPWIALFWKVSNVSSFLNSENKAENEAIIDRAKKKKEEHKKSFKHKKGALSFSTTKKNVLEIATSTNPLLLILFLPGLLLMKRMSQLTIGTTLLWLFVLGAICPPLKPQLELDRMLVIMSYLLCLPAGYFLQALFDDQRRAPTIVNNLALSFSFGFLLTGILCTVQIWKNRTVVPISYETQLASSMVDAINTYHNNGRILFSGFVLHDYSGGHVAPLTAFTNKPLMASSHVHNLWSYKQIFPKEYLERGDAGIDEYLDIHNVSAAFAHEKKWRDYFRGRPSDFTEVWRKRNFTLFRRNKFPNTYFLSGSGKVLSQQTESIRLRVDTDEATISFRYYPFLTSSDCALSPAEGTQETPFIKISNCRSDGEITIRSIGPWQRLFHS